MLSFSVWFCNKCSWCVTALRRSYTNCHCQLVETTGFASPVMFNRNIKDSYNIYCNQLCAQWWSYFQTENTIKRFFSTKSKHLCARAFFFLAGKPKVICNRKKLSNSKAEAQAFACKKCGQPTVNLVHSR